MAFHKTIILIPTYNEAENLEAIFNEIHGLNLGADILFIDDHSPDGTGEIINQLANRFLQVNVIHRPGKSGIGSAHLEGIRWVYRNNYTTLITMDCDFSHSPKYLPHFIQNSKDCDIVIGSRYLKKGSLPGWNWYRKSLTYIGHYLTSKILKMPYDATGAFRLYRLDKIPVGVFDMITAQSYSFFFESLYIFHLNGFKIKEFPIQLPNRTYGHSKMTLRHVIHTMIRLIRVYFKKLTHPELFLYSHPPVFHFNDRITSPIANRFNTTQADWNVYWSKKKKTSYRIYDLIAVFCRKFIIKRTLNHFIKKYFEAGNNILHAGCGSGMVDKDVGHWMNISALDISYSALNIYRQHNRNAPKLICGDIFHIPIKNESFDGIYNLGVMEHFSVEEIHKILQEFYRILKPKKKMVIFWAPEFGSSVAFLKLIHYIFNNLLKRNVKLHPAEITRVRSQEQVKNIFTEANFKILKYYFGVRDLFIHSIIVVEKNNP